LVDGEHPPTPEQLAQFSFRDDGWCADDLVKFAKVHNPAVFLAYLRHRRFGEAMDMLLKSPAFGQGSRGSANRARL
jgi:hypothetical protein